MPQSSFYADGETYSTATVTSNDTPGSATPSQAPSSFFKSGGIYNALAEESTTLTLFQQLLASTQAAQAAAAASATAAAASAASMPSASSSSPLVDGTASPGTANSWSRGDHVHPTDTSRAPLASPALTGTPTAPTPTAGDNSTKIATTAFVLANAATGNFRPQLTAATTYYVNGSTGSDTLYDGKSATVSGSTGPFATIGKAMTVAGSIDCGPWQLTISVAAGTYTPAVVLPRVVGALPPILTGVGSTTILSTGTSTAITNNSGSTWQVNSMKLTTTGGSANCLFATAASTINFQSVEFGACGSFHMFAQFYSTIQNTGTYTITGSAQAHMIVNASTINITYVGSVITGTLAFSLAFAYCNRGGLILTSNGASTWNITGATVTGTRYNVQNGGVIDTTGGGASVYPGSAAGTGTNFSVTPWGLYQ